MSIYDTTTEVSDESNDDQTLDSWGAARGAYARSLSHEEDCLCDGTGEVHGRLCWSGEVEREEENARTFDVEEELNL